MTIPAQAAPARSASPPGAFVPVLAAAGLGVLAWAALFRVEIQAAVHVWFDSTAYSHCFFVLPIAGWLAWDRRAAARGLLPVPTAWPALAVLPCALAWFAAERIGIMEGRQLAAVVMLIALAVSLLGWRLAWEFSSSLAYLLFLVPFGSFLTPDLQVITAWCVETGLTLLDIPHVVDAFTIEVPGAMFYVAEACAGLRFLIAAIAFGVLYACLTYRSPWRRLVFILASCTVPILANGIRALGIVVAGYLIGSAEAAAADHIIYGWGFFSAVIVLMTLAGLPFRQDLTALPPAVPTPGRPPGLGRALAAALPVLLLAAIAPLAAATLNSAEMPQSAALPGFVATAECKDMGDKPVLADGMLVQHFSCGSAKLTASLRVLPPRATPAALRTARSAATSEQDAADATTSAFTLDNLPGQTWRVVEIREPDRIAATAAWTHGAPDPGGMSGRIRMALDSITGGAAAPVLVGVALADIHLVRSSERDAAKAVLRGFLGEQTALLQALSGG